MLTKTYEVTIKSVDAMELINALGKRGIKFAVGDEYVDELDPNHTWYRDFIIRTSKRKMDALKKAVGIRVS